MIAYPDKPIYIECLKDGQDVAIDKNKFDGMLHDKKVKMFREEMCVIALERWVIHSRNSIPFTHAYHKSLHKTITRLTKGWASEFICENLESFVRPDNKEVEYAIDYLKQKEIL